MARQKKTKGRQENEIRDAYMAFTIGVQAKEFDRYLPIVMNYMDSHSDMLKKNAHIVRQSNYMYSKIRRKDFKELNDEEYRNIKQFYENMYEDLQILLRKHGCGKEGDEKSKKLSCRKVLNTYIKKKM